MIRFAVIGHPIGHSLSPLMHSTAFKLLELEHSYEALDVAPDELNNAVDEFRKNAWGGFNVTTPHKEAVIPFLDEIAPDARAMGSVNTVANRRGKLSGYNTDIIGIERSLEPYRLAIERSHCLILGAGGAARSVAYALSHIFHTRSLSFAARNPERAESIIRDLRTPATTMNAVEFTGRSFDAVVQRSTLIVNATTVGMHPNIADAPLASMQYITPKHIVFDLVYRPLTTKLLRNAKLAGARTIDGLEMFLHQGAEAFRLWLGMKMPLGRIRQVLEKSLAERD